MAKKKRRFGQKKTTETSSFVGRKEYLERFLTALADDQGALLFNAYGQSGVGKTTLLRRYEAISKTQNLLTVWADAEDTDLNNPLDLMNHLIQQVDEKRTLFKNFDKYYKDYLQEKGKLDADPDRPKGIAGKLMTSGLKAVGKIGQEMTPFGSYIPVDALAEVGGELADFAIKKISNKDTLALVLNPVKILTPFWIEGMNKVTDKKNLVLFIDTYEAAPPTWTTWLHRLLKDSYGEIDAFYLVIAGQSPLDSPQWGELEEEIEKLPLAPFSKEEATHYLQNNGFTDSAVIAAILTLSDCLPVYLALLAETDSGELGAPNEQVVERFLRHLTDPIERHLALQAALPNQLTQDVIERLLPEENKGQAKAYFEWLRKRPFVQKRGNHWTYHPVVKNLMRRHQREVSVKEWEHLHSSLATWYQQRAERLQTTDSREEWVRDKEWRDLRLEYHFHRLCEHYKQQLPAFIRDFVSIFWFSKFEDALPLSAMLEQVETLLQPEKGWAIVLSKGVYGLLNEADAVHHPEILKMAQWINKSNWLENKIERSIFYFLQGCYELELDNAINAYQNAITINPDYHEAFYNLGIAYKSKGELDNAINAYQKAIAIKPD